MHDQPGAKPGALRPAALPQTQICDLPRKPDDIGRRDIFQRRKDSWRSARQFHQAKADGPDNQLFSKGNARHKWQSCAKPKRAPVASSAILAGPGVPTWDAAKREGSTMLMTRFAIGAICEITCTWAFRGS